MKQQPAIFNPFRSYFIIYLCRMLHYFDSTQNHSKPSIWILMILNARQKATNVLILYYVAVCFFFKCYQPTGYTFEYITFELGDPVYLEIIILFDF